MGGGSRVIGGVFGLEPLPSDGVRSAGTPPFARAPALWTVNGRSAIRVLCGALRPRQVWVPSYLCDAVLLGLTDPASARFYEVTAELAVSGHAWLFNGTTFWTFDDPIVVAQKTLYVRLAGYGGAMVWSLDGDDADGTLTKTIYTTLH